MAAAESTEESHQYLSIRPSYDSLTADRRTAQFTQLHEAVSDSIGFSSIIYPAVDEIAYQELLSPKPG